MNSYLRMLKMIRPYTTQAILAVVFITMNSFFSVSSFTMISPFLKAMFLDEPAPTQEVVVEGGLSQRGLTLHGLVVRFCGIER